MQKLPKAPDRKRGDACAKEGTMSAKKKKKRKKKKKKKPILFQQWLAKWQHLNLPCCWWKAHCACFYEARWLTFPRVAAVSFTNNPRLKTPNNGLIKKHNINTI